MIRLIATDLDGTLLEPDGTLPDGTYETVEKLTRRGVLFTACSGRQYANLRRLFAPVARHMAFICENGALCLYGGRGDRRHSHSGGYGARDHRGY